ncbi:hypothetical protein Q3G72_015124 [Acer saccharum]|nr:hypothetical protein Q3G72_015124 [Acer saccharum]
MEYSSKTLNIIFIATLLMAFAISVYSNETPLPESEDHPYSNNNILRRFLADDPRTTATVACDKYPRVCRAKGSSGPNCCKKKCVDVSTDKLNCGKCGSKCNYSQMCCQGKCVNTSVNAKHCGRCNNSCKKGSSCAYGMCSYAN